MKCILHWWTKEPEHFDSMKEMYKKYPQFRPNKAWRHGLVDVYKGDSKQFETDERGYKVRNIKF